MLILGIETSCDDTSLCLLKGSKDLNEHPEVIYHESFNSEKLLAKWGGVVPEIASRAHVQKLPLLVKALIERTQHDLEELDLISVTTHPGLLGPLLSGLSLAKTICQFYEKDLLPVNHLYAHLEAIHIDQKVDYPYLGVLVSGGHSLFCKVSGVKSFEVLGSTIDDAAGEAFDKGGKLLGLGYPAGREIDQLAKSGDDKAYSFPIGLEHSNNCNLSYSGVKSSLRQFVQSTKKDQYKLEDVCASYQKAIIDALILKTKFARQQVGSLPIVVGGGVACNSSLRTRFNQQFDSVYFVTPRYCTDNGAMIANYALRNYSDRIAFPDCLSLDTKNKFIDKHQFKNMNQDRYPNQYQDQK